MYYSIKCIQYIKHSSMAMKLNWFKKIFIEDSFDKKSCHLFEKTNPNNWIKLASNGIYFRNI